jgi:hypothetical protein
VGKQSDALATNHNQYCCGKAKGSLIHFSRNHITGNLGKIQILATNIYHENQEFELSRVSIFDVELLDLKFDGRRCDTA